MKRDERYRAERRALDALRPMPGNPRRHSAAQLAKLEASILAYGFAAPILVDESGEIVAGEARWLAARAVGVAEVPVYVLDGLTAPERAALRLADNRIALDATWDEQLLADALRGLEAASMDLTLPGFDEAEIAALLDPPAPDDDGRADLNAPPPAEPETRLGDVWLLGAHRLICGDSTSDETLARLFADTRPAAVALITDPPYGMSYEGGRSKVAAIVTDPPYGMSFGKGKEAGSTPKGALVKAHGMILNDDLQGDALVDLVANALAAGLRAAAAECALYVCFTWRTWIEFETALRRAGRKPAACIVWDKGSIGLGFQHYRPQHEFMFYSAGARWFGGNAESDVWTLSRGATGEYVHPTQKPVSLIERAIANSTRVGDAVLDLFGGSGSTLIACERLGRAARLVELDPKYCDAIVRRWETFTGRTATREAYS